MHTVLKYFFQLLAMMGDNCSNINRIVTFMLTYML